MIGIHWANVYQACYLAGTLLGTENTDRSATLYLWGTHPIYARFKDA